MDVSKFINIFSYITHKRQTTTYKHPNIAEIQEKCKQILKKQRLTLSTIVVGYLKQTKQQLRKEILRLYKAL